MKELFTKRFWEGVKDTFDQAREDAPETSFTQTSMNTEHFKHLLEAKERELLSEIANLQEDARATGEAEVRDPTDDATVSRGASESLEEGAIASDTLTQVRDALKRIENGTYGKCVTCGKQIPEARLEAVPWALYCVEHQEKLDRAAHKQTGGSTL